MLRPAESPRVRYGKTSGYGRRKKQPRLPNFPAGAEASVEQQKAPAPNATTVLPKVGIALALGTANRVSQKLCLSSALSSHYLVVSLMLSVCYTMVYSCVLAVKVAQKRVPLSDIRNAPVVLFAVIGFGEAAGSALGTYGAAKLGTSSAAAALLPVLSQSLLIWQLIWSKVVVNARFKLNNYAGVLLVAAGIALVSWPSSGASVAGAVSSASFSAVLACVFSTCPPALSTTAKQRVFAEMRQRLGGREVDLFVVNTLGSSLQVLFTLLFLPTVASARGVSLPELPNAFTSGFAVLFGAAGPWEPFFALLYALINLAFNISALVLLRSTSAVIASVSLTLSVPFSAAAFALVPLPYLTRTSLGNNFILGSAIVLLGVATYNDLIKLPFKPSLKAKATDKE